MSNKSNWAEVDKRIRDRRVSWSAEERKDLERDLLALPDVGDKAREISVPQPAFVRPEAEQDAAAAVDTTTGAD